MSNLKQYELLAIVIPTKDRIPELRRLLASLQRQRRQPAAIIIVESGSFQSHGILNEFPTMNIKWIHFSPPSAARQRNAGLREIGSDREYVGFFDDDIVLEQNALEEMMRYWQQAPAGIGGATFNLKNSPTLALAWVKHLPWIERLGLYNRQKGVVLSSGFQTMIDHCDRLCSVQWFPSGASLWRRRVLSEFQFDEWFTGHSYLEDLEFSYRVGKKYGLVVLPEAEFFHIPPPPRHRNWIQFGRQEVINRLYFVRRFPEFATWKCYVSLFLRMIISLVSAVKDRDIGFLFRFIGNIEGFLSRIS